MAKKILKIIFLAKYLHDLVDINTFALNFVNQSAYYVIFIW